MTNYGVDDATLNLRNAPTPLLDATFTQGFGDEFPTDFVFNQQVYDQDATFDCNTIKFDHEEYNPTIYAGHSSFVHGPSSSYTGVQTLDNNAYAQSFGNFSMSDSNVNNSAISSSASVKSDKSTKQKCMTRNAVAARENREKKKREQDSIRLVVEQMTNENVILKKELKETKDAYALLQSRNVYLESILNNIPQIIDLVEHINTHPKNKLSSVNYHSNGKVDEESMKRIKTKHVKSTDSPDVNNNSSAGVCLHLKPSKQMSLHFCQICSSKPFKSWARPLSTWIEWNHCSGHKPFVETWPHQAPVDWSTRHDISGRSHLPKLCQFYFFLIFVLKYW